MSASDEREQGLRPAPLEGEVVGRVPRRPRPRQQDAEFDEGPSADDIERFGDVTRTCPECHKEVFDDAEVCYHCGHAFSRAPSKGLPRWAIVTAGVVLAAFLLMLLSGGSWRLW
ncbi:MAG: hypothetical protein ACKVS8_02000 [Phycisphaerales bacterium]